MSPINVLYTLKLRVVCECYLNFKNNDLSSEVKMISKLDSIKIGCDFEQII